MGYVGPRQAAPILIDGLRRLEYRGYDSAGVAVGDHEVIAVRKSAGKLQRLADLLADDGENGEGVGPVGHLGIGHTRWATHGRPTDANAHPHADPTGEFVVVHNGIIENYLELREQLAARGHEFRSETDTEVLAHLIAETYEGDLAAAVRDAVSRARGAYALVAITSREPDKIVAVRMISPLVVGYGDGEMMLASDIPALLPHTRDVLVIEDGEMVTITAEGADVETLGGTPVDRLPGRVDWDTGKAEKGGYPHFMLKEIFEQPAALAETLVGRMDSHGTISLDGVGLTADAAARLDRVWFTACGTAYHAALLGKAVIESMVRIPVEVAYAHELRYDDPLIDDRALTVAVSQSGETVDTLVAARLAQDLGSRLIAITNVVGSSLARQADDVLYTRAGPEIAVASTKAYSTMLMGQYLLGMYLAEQRNTMDEARATLLSSDLAALPDLAAETLKHEERIAELAAAFRDVDDVYFIGRGLDYIVATEGSLKLKEISYCHSEAMPAGELKHGTLALITDGTPVIAVVTQQHVYDKTISAIQETKARGATVFAVAYDDDPDIRSHADHVLPIPRTQDLLSPVLSIVPLQLLAYHVARQRGHDIDQPRNLAKSVTVE
jgi:glucosamine--fructose-6-phosphate aminotransferase (isomerizing)